MKTIFLLLGLGLSISLTANNLPFSENSGKLNDSLQGNKQISVFEHNMVHHNFLIAFDNCQFCNYSDFYFFPVNTTLEEIDIDIYNYRYEEELNQAAEAASILSHSVILDEIELNLPNSDYEEELLFLED